MHCQHNQEAGSDQCMSTRCGVSEQLAQLPYRPTQEGNDGEQERDGWDQAGSHHEVKRHVVQQVTRRRVETNPNLALLLEILKAQSLASD